MFKRSLFSFVLLLSVSSVVFASDETKVVEQVVGAVEATAEAVAENASAVAEHVGEAVEAAAEAAPGYAQRVGNAFDRMKTSLQSAGNTVWTPVRNGINGWNESTTGGFINGMMNPKRYVEAAQDMYQAGAKESLPTLWSDHKPVIAGTALAVTTTALVVCAYYNGWFSKAKKKLQEWKNN